jgi:hypothetical protein
MIVSKQKPFTEIVAMLEDYRKVFLIGCAKCATVCKSGGEEEIWQIQEALQTAGKEITGAIVIDEVCHMLRTQRDLRSKKDMVDDADALLVLACGAGVQSVSSGSIKRTLAGLDTLFLGNIRRFGQFEQRCSLCCECILPETGGICPITICPKGMLNGPCGGMDQGHCETDGEMECVWVQIFQRLQAIDSMNVLAKTVPPKNYARKLKPGKLKVEK